MNNNYRFYEIDLLRFVAALSVVSFHYLFRGYAANNMTVLSFPYLAPIAKYGFLGFHLFFIISGFVILLTTYEKTSSDFVLSRIKRLFPAYWTAVTLTYLTITTLGSPRYEATLVQYFINLSMLHSFVGIESIDGVYWTLAIELKFYFIIFVIITCKQVKNIKLILYIWMVLTVLLTIFHTKYLNFILFPEWSYYFIAGCCFYIIYREGITADKVLAIFCSYLTAIYNLTGTVSRFHGNYNTELSILLVVTIVSIFYLIFFIISCKKSHVISKKYFYILGILTYPIYLIHQNIGFILFNFLNEYGINKNTILFIVFLIIVLTSYSIHFKIEKKCSKILGDYISHLLMVFRNNYLKGTTKRNKTLTIKEQSRISLQESDTYEA